MSRTTQTGPVRPFSGRRTVEYEIGESPEWSRWREAKAVIAYPPHLRRTICIALVVGTVLFAINQLDIVLRGEVTSSLWLKCALTYLVPFCTSNLGMLLALRRPAPS